MASLSGDSDGIGNLLPCYMVNNFTSDSEQCNFITQNDCLEEEALDYVYFVYCIMGTEMRYLSIISVVSLIIVFFLTLSVIADEFLCPSLLSIAKSLRMSDNLAVSNQAEVSLQDLDSNQVTNQITIGHHSLI